MQKELQSNKPRVAQPYSNKILLELLVKWLILRDMSLDTVQSEEFVDMMLYARPDAFIPTVKAIERYIWAKFKAQREQMRTLWARIDSRICFTTEIWSSASNDTTFMAITGRWIDRKPQR